jgi:hypothetical protein
MFCPKCATENPNDSRFCRTCRANLSNVLAVVDGEILPTEIDANNNIAELYSTGVRNVILGMGFLVTSIFLKLIPPTDGMFWLFFLIPSFCLVASGVSRILKYESLMKLLKTKPKIIKQTTFTANQANKELPTAQQQYIKPKFETNELVEQPVSVTENTTKFLNKEIK